MAPAAPRGHRLDPRDQGGDVAGRPARRRHRRDQLLQPRVQRPPDPDGALADEAGHAPRPRALAADDHPRGDPGRADGEVQGVPVGQLQLLAVDPRQRRGGALGRQGGQLDQALRQRPGRAGEARAAGGQHPQHGPGHHQRRAVPHRRPAQPGDPDRPPRVRPLRDQRRRRRGGGPGGRRRPGLHPDGRGGEEVRHRAPPAHGPARRPGGHRPDPGRHAGPGRQAGGADPARTAGQDRSPQARRHLHLPREQPAVHPDQVQRPGPRPGLDDPRGPAEGRTTPSTGPSSRAGTTSTGRASSPRCSRPTPG